MAPGHPVPTQGEAGTSQYLELLFPRNVDPFPSSPWSADSARCRAKAGSHKQGPELFPPVLSGHNNSI